MSDDLLAEFDKLLNEKKINGGGKDGNETGRNGSTTGHRNRVADDKSVAGGTPKRIPVPARLQKGPANKAGHTIEGGVPEGRDAEVRGADGGGSRVKKLTGKGIKVIPFVPTEIPRTRYPNKFKGGQLEPGESVWYRGERHYIVTFPPDFSGGTFARIATLRIRPDEPVDVFMSRVLQASGLTFCVPVDMLELAPMVNKPYAKQPTKAAVERRLEMKKTGATDIGDEVAVLLRECETLEQVYECASLYVSMSVADLKAKYKHLNPGGQRMNLGNRMRNVMKERVPTRTY